jgi:hypothetical protein
MSEALMNVKKNAYRILVGKSEWKRPLGRPRRRWVGNIKMDLREMWWDGTYWVDVVLDMHQWRALVKTVMNLRVPKNAVKFFLSSCTIYGFSRGLSSMELFCYKLDLMFSQQWLWWVLIPGMLPGVIQNFTSVPDERTTSIFRVDSWAMQGRSKENETSMTYRIMSPPGSTSHASY